MLNDTIKLFGLVQFKLSSLSIKLKESGTVWIENYCSTGSFIEIKKVNKFDCGDLVIGIKGLRSVSILCFFGSQ